MRASAWTNGRCAGECADATRAGCGVRGSRVHAPVGAAGGRGQRRHRRRAPRPARRARLAGVAAGRRADRRHGVARGARQPPACAETPPAAAPRPAGLPAAGHYTGRADDLGRLTALVDAGRRAVVVAGPPGIGKSALAARLAHRLSERYPDGQLAASLGGGIGTPATPEEVLERFLDDLGAGLTGPADLDRLVARFRSALGRAAGAPAARRRPRRGPGAAVAARRARLPHADHQPVVTGRPEPGGDVRGRRAHRRRRAGAAARRRRRGTGRRRAGGRRRGGGRLRRAPPGAPGGRRPVPVAPGLAARRPRRPAARRTGPASTCCTRATSTCGRASRRRTTTCPTATGRRSGRWAPTRVATCPAAPRPRSPGTRRLSNGSWTPACSTPSPPTATACTT